MVLALQKLRRAFQERRRNLANGVARIEELNRHYHDGAYCSLDDHSIQYTTAWEELFSRPEWHQADLSHKGQCSCCGTAVSRSSVTCPTCAAVWTEPGDQDKLRSKFRFGISSVVLSALIVFLIDHYFSCIFNATDGAANDIVSVAPDSPHLLNLIWILPSLLWR